MRRQTRSDLLIVCIAASALNQRALPAQAPEKGPLVTVRTVKEQAFQGTLVSLSLDAGLSLEVDRELHKVPAADLVTITRSDSTSRSAPDPWWSSDLSRESVAIELADGDRILGRLTDGPADHVTVESEGLGKLTIPLERIARLNFFSAALPAFADSSRWFQAETQATDDRILLTNGDTIHGFLTGLDREGIQIEVDDQPTTVPLRLAVAARLVHPSPRAIDGQYAVISLMDGQRLTVSQLEWTSSTVRAKTVGNETIEPPAERVHFVELFGGRWEWLSARPPSHAEHIPMLSTQWKHHVNKNALNGPLKVAGVIYDRGLGVHSKSVLAYQLDGTFMELVTSFGLDDASGSMANVRALIVVDGRQQFAKDNVIRGQLQGPVRISVAGAKSLELIVDFGRNGDIQDRFNWIEPMLVRAPP